MQTFRRSAALVFAALVSIAGCSGEDGKDGAAGVSCTVTDNGTSATITCPNAAPVTVADGVDGDSCTMVDNGDATATITCGTDTFEVKSAAQLVESCAGCHNSGLTDKHARANQVAISGQAIAQAASLDAVPVANADLVITFNVKVDGVNRNDFTNLTTVTAWVYDPAFGAGERVRYRSTDLPAIFATFTVTRNFNGNYSVRLPNFGSGGTLAADPDTSFMLSMDTGNSQPQATVVVHYNTVEALPKVSNQACINCHGSFVFAGLDANGIPGGHRGANPIGVEGCVICHVRTDNSEERLAGTINLALGTRLMGFVHGIHNSHNMADGVYSVDGGTEDVFSIGFPGYMQNCSTCHDTAAGLAAAAAAPVAFAACISCHDSWDGFPRTVAGGTLQGHRVYTADTNCAGCHEGTIAPATIAGFHNGLLTERRGVIWNGEDVSVTEGEKFALAVTGVKRVGANYEVSWTASYNGAAVSPCNTDFAVGPVFLGVAADSATGKAASNMQFVKAYGQGDDWVNANRTGSVSPGQPATSATLTSGNTNCTANVNVAVTTTPVDTFVAAGTRGTMALQGKPQLRFALGAGTSSEFIQARAKSPTFPFVVPAADGDAVAGAARRTIVDTAKCLDCHKGTLYQHGGNRVDSVDLCVTCHNPASSEQNVRVGFGVDASEAYDGKAGETYDMRTMIHAVHSAGETGRSYVIYRTRGIYFFGNQAALDDAIANKNWPTTGGVTCTNSEGALVTYHPVYGSVPGATEKTPVVATNGTCDLTTGPAATSAWQIHNVILVEYPRPLNDCGACHTGGSETKTPDPTKAVAVSFEAGGTTYGNQLDDVLIGPVAQSCMTCHQSGDASIQFGLREHAYDNGWEPTVFVNGRQTLIDAATP